MLRFVLFLFAVSASPQVWAPPDIRTERLDRRTYPRVPVDEVASGNEQALAALREQLHERSGGVRQIDVALIRVTVKGEWWVSAREAAVERAAAVGANFLLEQFAFGEESMIGAERVYRAVRLERYDGVPAFTLPQERVQPEAARAAAAAPQAPRWTPSLKVPRREPVPLEWIWMDHDFILSHRLGLDLSRLSDSAWRELSRAVRTHFPAEEHARLLELRRRRARVVVDLRRRTLWPAS